MDIEQLARRWRGRALPQGKPWHEMSYEIQKSWIERAQSLRDDAREAGMILVPRDEPGDLDPVGEDTP